MRAFPRSDWPNQELFLCHAHWPRLPLSHLAPCVCSALEQARFAARVPYTGSLHYDERTSARYARLFAFYSVGGLTRLAAYRSCRCVLPCAAQFHLQLQVHFKPLFYTLARLNDQRYHIGGAGSA